MILTVAICTWNRAELLAVTLERMCALRISPELKWELLVVNNNCTDETDDVIDRFVNRLPIRRLMQFEQGLSHARNMALDEASGDWIIFTDDDVLVSEDWLESYSLALTNASGAVAFLGGEITPWFPDPPEMSLSNALPMVRDGFCARSIPERSRIETGDQYLPYGANFAVCVATARRFRFDPLLGVKGKARILGEDVVFMQTLLSKGFEGQWVANASVQHYVDPKRLTLPSLRRTLYDGGRTMARRGNGLDGRFRILGIPLWACRSIIEGAIAIAIPLSFYRDRSQYYKAFRDFWYYSGFVKEHLFGKRDADGNP